MNPDPMNLWSNDHIDGDTKGTNHLVHENVEFVRFAISKAWNWRMDQRLECRNDRFREIYNAFERYAKDVVSNGI